MTTIATLCARGGSKGVPRKNILPILGKPLIAYTIEQAQACTLIDRVYVSTEDAEIAEVARQAGAEVPFMRPAELATDTAAKIPVIEHLVNGVIQTGVDVRTVVDLDPTSPLREVADIEACIHLLDDDTDVVITGYEAEKNPYFNMVEQQPDGYYGLVKPSDADAPYRRQAAPKVYAMNASIYVWHRHTLSKGLWEGRARLHVMPRERSIDIDHPVDLKLVEFFMQEKRDAGKNKI
ncbi:acylneuraminate cytidylyltransferase family protein [Nitrospina watsonii]|uniref:Post-translational flagellin modification protein B n=1 Tax=Nitrospina watsonii TaxID=1323948 RepID=A0ABN8W1M5_9BACT|nr:acylneuraminate cytidylyltransferase family protein [Nitrospina watsonii]CAI2717001.1 Post-translational flagellin modification protein B [Nitrospina watsonii]